MLTTCVEADEAYVIGKRGQYTPVGAYLAGDEIIKIAVEHGAQLIHPGTSAMAFRLRDVGKLTCIGYGFLSENAEFARNVEKAGLIVSRDPFTLKARTVWASDVNRR